ncbi:MAG: Mfa1 fimbrilin C-terminal domain-containing protein [Alistipes sp.]|nr:Mfa1 fimbrilin C-terminal domain-containing protein [Alistipes sp.]
MNAKYFFLALAAIGMVACSEKDEVSQNTTPADISADKGYIALNLKAAEDVTRVEGGVYEDGTADEQAVTEATFYFFDSAGNAFSINANGNYYNVAVADNGGTQAPNIESMTNPVLVVEKYKGQFPAKVVAVVNYKGTQSLSLNDLKNNLKTVGHTDGKNFIMTNSVYANAAAQQVDATELTIDNFQTTADNALANPVTIYVERVTAKMNLSAGDAAFDTGAEVDGGKVMAKVLGWNVIGNQTESYYIKTIDPSWTDSTLGFVWNDAPYYRSYWAAKSVAADVDKNISFNELTNNNATVEYLGEQVGARATYVVAAQLQRENGEALEIAQWYGTSYIGESALLVAVAPTLKNKLMHFDGVDTYTSIDDSQIKCVAGMTGAESYEVKFQLADGVETTNWYSFDGANYTAVDANAELAKVEPAKIWKSGMTYYYADVKHLGSDGTIGEYGIIRNHSYAITVNGVKGLGTPVYDPAQEVVPVKPTDKETYISAEINVLSWRVVSEEVTLE